MIHLSLDDNLTEKRLMLGVCVCACVCVCVWGGGGGGGGGGIIPLIDKIKHPPVPSRTSYGNGKTNMLSRNPMFEHWKVYGEVHF